MEYLDGTDLERRRVPVPTAFSPDLERMLVLDLTTDELSISKLDGSERDVIEGIPAPHWPVW